MELLNKTHYNELLRETEQAINDNIKLVKERDRLKKAAKRMTAANNRLQIKIAELTKEPDAIIVKINDKVKTEKPWCSF